MATELKRYVCTASAGGDGTTTALTGANAAYASLEACMNANEQNLVDADKYFNVEIFGDCSTADTTRVNAHNYTTDATRYVNIYTTSAARHKGIYSTSYYRLEQGDDSPIYLESVSYITFTGILFKRTGTSDSCINTNNSATNILFDKCIIIGAGTGLKVGYSTIRARNCIIIGGTYYSYISNVINTIENCVIINTGSLNAVYRAESFLYVKNCYAHSVSGTAYSPATITTSASSDGSESTTTAAYDTDTFTNVTAGSENFHLPNTSSPLYDAGTDLSGTFTDDIDGDTRVQWDIGADEYTAGDEEGSIGFFIGVSP
jgi:hypothetical protein